MAFATADPERKARAIAMATAGASYSEILKTTGYAQTTVQRWMTTKPRQRAMITSQRAAVELNLGQRIAELLNANIEAVTVLARQFSDPRWVASQSASDLIAVYNAVGDRTIQILASVQPAGDGAGSGEPPTPGAGELE